MYLSAGVSGLCMWEETAWQVSITQTDFAEQGRTVSKFPF
jgi:hypothetical protein